MTLVNLVDFSGLSLTLVDLVEKTCTGWKVNVICGEHNHESAIFLEGHPFVKKLTDEEKQYVKEAYSQNIAPRDILAKLKKMNPNNVSTKETIYDKVRRIRTAEQCGRTLM